MSRAMGTARPGQHVLRNVVHFGAQYCWFAALLMIPLAITSMAGWIRLMGGRNWNLLHRLVYITALGGVLHYYWKVSIKLPPVNPLRYAAVVGLLLVMRAAHSMQKRRQSAR